MTDVVSWGFVALALIFGGATFAMGWAFRFVVRENGDVWATYQRELERHKKRDTVDRLREARVRFLEERVKDLEGRLAHLTTIGAEP